HTGLYRETEGHEYYLRNFLQIQGNYGFHAYKINDATDEEEPGPTHGCVNLPAGDMEALYHWVKIGTPVEIRYVNADTAGTS
ncbi:MAG: L,D-transpeptidase, partial [Clostridia bacterium]|nr:L,D-transpeptidase [Clostridia bacterium]